MHDHDALTQMLLALDPMGYGMFKQQDEDVVYARTARRIVAGGRDHVADFLAAEFDITNEDVRAYMTKRILHALDNPVCEFDRWTKINKAINNPAGDTSLCKELLARLLTALDPRDNQGRYEADVTSIITHSARTAFDRVDDVFAGANLPAAVLKHIATQVANVLVIERYKDLESVTVDVHEVLVAANKFDVAPEKYEVAAGILAWNYYSTGDFSDSFGDVDTIVQETICDPHYVEADSETPTNVSSAELLPTRSAIAMVESTVKGVPMLDPVVELTIALAKLDPYNAICYESAGSPIIKTWGEYYDEAHDIVFNWNELDDKVEVVRAVMQFWFGVAPYECSCEDIAAVASSIMNQI